MSRKFTSAIGFSVIAALAASPAFAGGAPVPEPELAGGLFALGAMGLGYRLLSRRFKR